MKRAGWIRAGASGIAAVALSLLFPVAGMQAGFASGRSAPSVGRILGVVPVRGVARDLSVGGSAGNLIYHGGPVEHVNTTYAIYWVPSGYAVSAGYESLTNGFFHNVAAASGQTTNVYESDTQYSDGSGKISYSSAFGGAYVDTSTLPLAGCVDAPATACVNDSQIQAEIAKDIVAAGWSSGPTHEFFMFTAKGIGSCTDVTSTTCAFTTYCAYHSWIGSGSNVTLYANMPYADTSSSTCDSGQHPNGDDADATINVASHEHNETITDEQGSAWYDSSGNENGDKCAWNFGAAQGQSGAEYNQTINGAHYYLQQEWSNVSSGCVQQGT
ncbi:MAG TPA: hypothetical protein VG815_06655 [Chloroflexota bacterium]|jgi:hypothetical protein|nr:hypothetical protein [Chloroflexota bacterium]